jgi:hypothetical protein
MDRLGGPLLEAFDEGSEEESGSESGSSSSSSVVTDSTATDRKLAESHSSSHMDDNRSEVNSEYSYASTAASNFSSSPRRASSQPHEPRVSIMGDLPTISVGGESESKGSRTSASAEREARATVKLTHERARSRLIEKAWSSGVQGRRRLEAGITIDVVKRLTSLRVQYGEDDFETAFNLVLWIVESWPCEPARSTNPVDPWKLGRDCGEMLAAFRPGGDRMDPNNSAFLLPRGLREHAVGMDMEERRGAANEWTLREGGKHIKRWEEEGRKRREERGGGGGGGGPGVGMGSPSLSKRLYAGINDED